MELPIEISNYIKTFLRPVEGFKISANQKFKNNDCFMKIYYSKFHKNDNEYLIKGARIFQNDAEECGFLISIPKPKNKADGVIMSSMSNNAGAVYKSQILDEVAFRNI